MTLLYPSDPLDIRKPDDAFAEEFEAMRSAGANLALFQAEGLAAGEFRPRPALVPQEQVLYRGWMLTPAEYQTLHGAIVGRGSCPLTNVRDYRSAHYLPEWYSTLVEMTPKTVVLAKDADLESALAGLGWSAYFVKDYVKSLTTRRGSIAKSPSEVREIISEIEKYRGQVEGGVCVREYERLRPETEERYFSFRDRVFGRTDSKIPPQIAIIAQRMNLPFISIDVAEREDGALRLIEIGDGQVSDRKKWDLRRFANMVCAEAANKPLEQTREG
jgi:hypothetical protein